MVSSKELLIATRPFAHEERWRSWWHLWTTIAVLSAVMLLLCSDLPWLVRLPFSVIAGLILIRLFVLFHDHQHRAILRHSKLADWLMFAFGVATLNPPSVWKRSHDHHHVNNSKSFGPNVGSFPLMTVDGYEQASMRQRFWYSGSRHPLTIALGYVTVFLVGMCIKPLFANPQRHFDAALAIACHGGLLMWLAFDEIDDLWLAALIPFTVSCGLGAYLFFAQHNFPGARMQTGRDWDYVYAALNSSSCIQMGGLMRWFTGNIGYHHVHHLNSRIPFYRLPEAMAAIDELQSPLTTSLGLRDVAACLRLKLWDQVTNKLVPWQAKSGHEPVQESRLAA
ncbi:MAG: fatty acid desaturase [Planctomycetaceae bacterium]